MLKNVRPIDTLSLYEAFSLTSSVITICQGRIPVGNVWKLVISIFVCICFLKGRIYSKMVRLVDKGSKIHLDITNYTCARTL